MLNTKYQIPNTKKCRAKITRNKKWEKVIDFTKIKKDGVDIDEVIFCLLKE